MTFDKYGLKNLDEVQKKGKKLVLDSTITQKNVKDLFVKVNGENFMRFKDRSERKITMTKNTFSKHTRGRKYISEGRHQMFPHIKSILNEPSEVWMHTHTKRGFQTYYIKHYEGKSILVATQMDELMTGLEIETWFEIDINGLERRKGLLLYVVSITYLRIRI